MNQAISKILQLREILNDYYINPYKSKYILISENIKPKLPKNTKRISLINTYNHA